MRLPVRYYLLPPLITSYYYQLLLQLHYTYNTITHLFPADMRRAVSRRLVFSNSAGP